MELCRTFDLIICPTSNGPVLRTVSPIGLPPSTDDLVCFLYAYGEDTCPLCFGLLTHKDYAGHNIVGGIEVEQDVVLTSCRDCTYTRTD